MTTKIGLSRFDGNQFKHYSVLDGLPSNFNWRLFHDSQDRIWLFNNLTPFTYIKKDSIYRIGNKVEDFYLMSIVEDSKGNIHFNTKNYNNRYVIDTNDNFIKKEKNWYLGERDGLSYYIEDKNILVKKDDLIVYKTDSLNILAFHFSFLNDNIYLISPYNIVRYNIRTRRLITIKEKEKNNHFITINQINDKIIIGRKKGYFIGENSTLKLVDSTRFISHILIDNNHNTWLPTIGKGLYFYPNLNHNVINYPDNAQFDMFLDKSDTSLYLSTKNSTFYHLKNKIKTKIYSDKTINAITNLFVLKNHTFINTYNKLKITSINLNEKPIIEIDKLTDTTLKVINQLEIRTGGNRTYFVNGDSALLGTRNGLYSFQFKSSLLEIKQLSKRQTLACCVKNNTILFGNETGLYHSINKKDSLLFEKEIIGGSIKSIIYSDYLESFLIGTEQGYLYKVSNKLDSIYRYKHLFNQIKNLSIKGLNEVLISTADKAFVFNLDNHTIVNQFGKIQGLGSNDIYKSFYFDSTFYISTNVGISIISEKESTTFSKSYPTYIKSISIDNSPINFSKNIVIPTQSNQVKIEFSNLTFWGNSEVKYKYRVLELNDKWIETNTPIIEFITFPYGSFTFQLKTIDVNGVERNEVLEFKLHKKPPFWLTTWFITLCAIIGLVLLNNLIRYYQRKKTKQIINSQEKELLKQKAILAEYKALRLQMNPHFLFNSLNAVQNSILDNDVEKANQYLTDFAKLMRQVLQFSTKESISLADEIILSKNYFKLEQNRCKYNVSFKVDVGKGINTEQILVPPMLLQPILENAIWHGIVPLNRDGEIILKLNIENDFIKAIILDNGIGFDESNSKQKKNKSHESIAIINTCNRLKYFDKSKLKKSQYIVISNSNNQGTTVEMYIYLKNNK